MADTTNTLSLDRTHPGVYSRIQKSTESYNVESGIITLFAADAFPKGKDGVIDFVSTTDEFHFKYGEPDYTKYGQQAYNIDEWLAAGGQAYVMRVLPDNATYSHAVLNIQTKVKSKGKKIHLDKTNEDVFVDDVFLRPTTAFIKKNNLNLNVLLGELTKSRDAENTIDGYQNNFLMMTYPEGRGEAYNNLGFRIYPNDSYVTQTDSQVYDFEVIRFDDDGDTTMVEGPFYVSFDKDAMNGNTESMYIEDVVNHYSQYLRVKFNQDVYLKIANLINPLISPNKMEILSGKTKLDSTTGQPMTYYDENTHRSEDIHLSLQRFNTEGQPVLKNGEVTYNIPESTDTVQQALVTLDNSIREQNYNSEADKASYMKNYFPSLLIDGFSPIKLAVNELLNPDPSNDKTKDTGLVTDFINSFLSKGNNKSSYNQYLALKSTYDNNPSESTLTPLLSEIDQIISNVRSIYFDYANKLSAAYTLTEKDSPDPQILAKYANDINTVQGFISRRDKISIFSVEHEKAITDIINEISDERLGLYEGTDLEGIGLILNDLEIEIKYVYENLISEAYETYDKAPDTVTKAFDDSNADGITAQYNRIMQIFSDMNNGYIIDSGSTSTHKIDIYATANKISNQLLDIINTIAYQSGTTILEQIIDGCENVLYADMVSFHNAVLTMITPKGTYDEEAIRANARQNIDIENNSLVATNSKFFNTNLVDYTNPVKMLLGSDGDFSYDPSNLSARSASIKNQIINAYKGNITSEISDTNLYPFDMILDARYPNEVKTAISNFARQQRKDCQFFADTAGSEFSVSPQDALEWRQSKFNIISEYVSIFSQDLTYYDNYTGRDIRFTPTYMLASKIPTNAVQYGLQYPMAGPRRGIIDGFTDVSWFPNDAYTEKLYKAHINYLEYDNSITTLGSQSTSLNGISPLTNINNMFTILKMQRGMKNLAKNYLFEFNNQETYTSMENTLNAYAQTFIADSSCEDVSITVSATDYDIQQRIVRVSVGVKFYGVIERVALVFNV